MNLTNEEKKRIADSATLLMQAFCEFKMAEDRIATMSSLVGNLLKMGLNEEMTSAAIMPYAERFREAQKEFFEVLGIGEENKEFWAYVAKAEQGQTERTAGIEKVEQKEMDKPNYPTRPNDSCIEG